MEFFEVLCWWDVLDWLEKECWEVLCLDCFQAIYLGSKLWSNLQFSFDQCFVMFWLCFDVSIESIQVFYFVDLMGYLDIKKVCLKVGYFQDIYEMGVYDWQWDMFYIVFILSLEGIYDKFVYCMIVYGDIVVQYEFFWDVILYGLVFSDQGRVVVVVCVLDNKICWIVELDLFIGQFW